MTTKEPSYILPTVPAAPALANTVNNVTALTLEITYDCTRRKNDYPNNHVPSEQPRK